ncbi:MAG: FosX/FosE/FosI family fosfomycin resistance hydrolase [Desulfobacteraceae bacterium]
MTIEGLSHMTFIVSDLDRTTTFLSKIFGAEEIYASGDATYSISRERFFLINGIWVAIMEGDALSDRTYNHIAFKIPDEEFDAYAEKIRSLNIEVREGRSRVDGEGRSLYFYDYDNHLFELHTGTLKQRLKSYKKNEDSI